MADKFDVSRDLLSNYEQGRTHLTDETIIRLAMALKVSADELLGIKTNKAPESEKTSLRFLRRLAIIETFPEAKKKKSFATLMMQ